MSNLLKDKIPKENIIIDLEATNKEEAIEKIAYKLYENKIIDDVKLFVQDVFDREAQGTTGFGQGVSIPHGKSKSVLLSSVAIAKLKQPLEWKSLDGKLVDVVFLLAITLDDANIEHLRVLATLSEKLMDDDFVIKIKKAQTIEEIQMCLL
jgi:PTS system, fructose subfamily, IIA component